MAWSLIVHGQFASGTFPNTNQTNITVPFKIVNAALRSTANGGLVQHGPYDVQLFTDSAATPGNEMKFHRMVYVEATGTFMGLVKLPQGNTGAVTDFYVAIGNSAVTTDQQDKAGTWETAAKVALVFGDGSAVDLTDDIGGTGLTNGGSIVVGTDNWGKGAVVGDGTTNSYAERSSAPVTAVPMTQFVIFNKTGDTSGGETIFGSNPSTSATAFELDLRPSFNIRWRVGGVNCDSTANNVWTSGAWSSVCGISSTVSNHAVYANGVSVGTSSSTATPGTPNNLTVLGRHINSGYSSQSASIVSLCVELNVAKNSDWPKAMHNTWIDSATYLSFTGFGTVPPTPVWSGGTPANGSEFAQGSAVTLDAQSTDAEDGLLTGTHVFYEYRMNGSVTWLPIGSPASGQTALVWNPFDGHHEVRATVTDSSSNTAVSAIRTFHANRYAVGGSWVSRGLTMHNFSQTSHYSYAFVPYHWPKTSQPGVTWWWRNGAGESTGLVSGTGPWTLSEGNPDGVKQYETNVPRLASIYAKDPTTPWPFFMIVTQTMLVNGTGGIPSGHPYKPGGVHNTPMRKRGQLDLDLEVHAWAKANWNIDDNQVVGGGHSAGASEKMYQEATLSNAPFSEFGGFNFAGLILSEPTWVHDDIAGMPTGTTWTNNGITLNYRALDSATYPLTNQGKLEAKVKLVSIMPKNLRYLIFTGSLDPSVDGIMHPLNGTTPYTSPPSFTTPDYAGTDGTSPYKGGFIDVAKDKLGNWVITHRGYTGAENNLMNYTQSGQDYPVNSNVIDMSDAYYHNNQVALFAGVPAGYPTIGSIKSGVSIYQLDPRNTLAMNWIAARTRKVRLRRNANSSFAGRYGSRRAG